ncbi:Erg28 domain-containing protein [Rhizoctonia solani AG-1 IA]|uniref:Erg28 domain-containing protein n=1 Tax=Thanatephorus cucumeris (strain AG1-IA) TaxID=983506 RepID=L8WQJ0_THACA|nr:Erg28 domain-containing protein [Rhizoctonia solani AG-1 IA]
MSLFILPQAAGLLPKWQLVVSSLAVFNTVQNFVTLSLTKRIYSKQPQNVTALQSRTFAIWTLTSAILRFYCAYHVNEKVYVFHLPSSKQTKFTDTYSKWQRVRLDDVDLCPRIWPLYVRVSHLPYCGTRTGTSEPNDRLEYVALLLD